MTPGEDKIKVGVSTDGVTIESEGIITARISNQIADLLSPFSEMAGLIGDRVRIFRQTAAINALTRAHEIASQRGLPVKPVPPKFLLEWLECASLEDEDDDELKTLWAELLASASQHPEVAKVAYIDFLRKIGSEDAKMLSWLAGDTTPWAGLDYYRYNKDEEFIERVPEIVEEALNKNKDISMGEILRRLEGAALQFNRWLLYISTPGHFVLPTDHYERNSRSYAVLEREGAVKIHAQDVHVSPAGQLQVGWLTLTKFGFDFVWACEGQITGRREGLGEPKAESEQE